MDKKTKFETQILIQRMLPLPGWMDITIMQTQNSRLESACREGGIQANTPGHGICGDGHPPIMVLA